MCGAILRVGEQNKPGNFTKLQLLDEHQFIEEELGSVGELSKSVIRKIVRLFVIWRALDACIWHALVDVIFYGP